jgi:hypothetical protein
MQRPTYDRATQPSTGRDWAWTGLGGWREWDTRRAEWVPSLPPPADAELSQSPACRRQFGTIAPAASVGEA